MFSSLHKLLSSFLYLVQHQLLWALQVDLKHVEHFISVIGAFEDQIFQKRARLLQRQKQRRERDKANKGHRHQPGQGQAGSKWKAAVPNASFTASLQPMGHNQSGLHHQYAVHRLPGYQQLSTPCVCKPSHCISAACACKPWLVFLSEHLSSLLQQMLDMHMIAMIVSSTSNTFCTPQC